MKPIFILTYFLTAFSFCHAQRLNKIYYGISSDSLHNGHQLEFKNDMVLEISTFPRHMSKQLIITFNYKKKGKTLEIYNDYLSKQDSVELINDGLTQFLKKLVLTIDRKAFTDSSSNLVYVLFN